MPVHENDNGIEKAADETASDGDLADKKRTRRVIGAEFAAIALAIPPLLVLTPDWVHRKLGSDGSIVAVIALAFTGLILSLAGAFVLKRVWWAPLLSGIVYLIELAGSMLWFFWHNFRM